MPLGRPVPRFSQARPLHQHGPAAAAKLSPTHSLDRRLHLRKLPKGRFDRKPVDHIAIGPTRRVFWSAARVLPELPAPSGYLLRRDEVFQNQITLLLKKRDLLFA